KRHAPVVVNSVEALPEVAVLEKVILQRAGVKSLVGVPIMLSGLAMGLLGFTKEKGRTDWPEDIGMLLKVVGEIFSNALERRRTGQELIETKEFLENVFRTTADGIIVSDANGVIVNVNFAVERMLGWTAAEMSGRHVKDMYPVDDACMRKARRMLAQLMEQGTVNNWEMDWLRKTGETVIVEANIS
ncbi:MAG: PAS domain S-box protein, partial [Gammaproteobacteria bacterium]|nr:PAS domain S-box protein [Gammaproteobacteria bacterium]